MQPRWKQFFQTEGSSSVFLLIFALIAIIWSNSPFNFLLTRFVDTTLFWINEVLMAIFFLLVGLELKRGFTSGYLTKLSQILLPAVAAIGGMIIPAFIYILINAHHSETLRGWATPVPTDIAFAVGILMLFGRKVPKELKLFLLALAIFDDIGAILILAFWYAHGFILSWILLSILIVGMIYFLARQGVRNIYIYLIFGAVLWFAFWKSGIHPTIAGVLLALLVPDDHHKRSTLKELESKLNPIVAYFVMPLFALANAGISFRGITLANLFDEVVIGIALGLFVGKQIGVFGSTWLMIKSGYAKMPHGCNWTSIYGVSLLCGIGFTMSLFLGTLSFQNDYIYLAEVRLGVMMGSLFSGIFGAIILRNAFSNK